MNQSAQDSQRLIRLVLGAAVFAPLLMILSASAQEPPASPPPASPVPASPIPPSPIPPSTTPAAPPNLDEFAKAVFFGQKFFERKDYAAAYQQFATADSLQPDQAGVLYNMALLLARTGRYSEAQGRVDRYLQLYPAGAERELANKLKFELAFQRELQKKRQTDQEYSELFTRGTFLYAKNNSLYS